jgi:hypothetical protein
VNAQIVREFKLSRSGSARGISCDAGGAFIDSIPLLKRARAHGREIWEPRNVDELSIELGTHYGLPIHISSKSAGLDAIARSLNAENVAHAQLVALHMQTRLYQPILYSYYSSNPRELQTAFLSSPPTHIKRATKCRETNRMSMFR